MSSDLFSGIVILPVKKHKINKFLMRWAVGSDLEHTIHSLGEMMLYVKSNEDFSDSVRGILVWTLASHIVHLSRIIDDSGISELIGMDSNLTSPKDFSYFNNKSFRNQEFELLRRFDGLDNARSPTRIEKLLVKQIPRIAWNKFWRAADQGKESLLSDIRSSDSLNPFSFTRHTHNTVNRLVHTNSDFFRYVQLTGLNWSKFILCCIGCILGLVNLHRAAFPPQAGTIAALVGIGSAIANAHTAVIESVIQYQI